MSGLFDLHLITALQTGWPGYRDSQEAFDELFMGVQPALLQSWREVLVDREPSFKAAFSPGHDDFPVIAVQLESEVEFERGPIGVQAYRRESDNMRVQQMLLKQMVSVTIISQHPEITRALHVICRAITMRLTPALLKHYLDIHFEDAADLAPDANLLAEDHGIYVRKQRYEALSEINVPDLEDVVSTEWVVGLDDAEPNANVTVIPGATDSGNVGVVL